MIVGPSFFFVHVPKTGGDSVRAWCHHLSRFGSDNAVPDWWVEDSGSMTKHEPASRFPGADQKKHRIASFRRLSDWTLSMLHELTYHETLMRKWGIQGFAPETALVHPFADYYLETVTNGARINTWLRCEYLLDDFVRFFDKQIIPCDVGELRAVPTKPVRQYPHNPNLYWDSRDVENIYKLNPKWSLIEKRLYPQSEIPLTN